MTLANAVKQRIINLAAKKKVTLHKLSLDSGIPYSTMSSFLNGKCSSITLTTLLHICEGTGISLKTFFDDPMFKDVSLNEKTSSEKR